MDKQNQTKLSISLDHHFLIKKKKCQRIHDQICSWDALTAVALVRDDPHVYSRDKML